MKFRKYLYLKSSKFVKCFSKLCTGNFRSIVDFFLILLKIGNIKKLKNASQFEFAHQDLCILIYTLIYINSLHSDTAYKISSLPYEYEVKKKLKFHIKAQKSFIMIG